jgi:hypothetical protein
MADIAIVWCNYLIENYVFKLMALLFFCKNSNRDRYSVFYLCVFVASKQRNITKFDAFHYKSSKSRLDSDTNVLILPFTKEI